MCYVLSLYMSMIQNILFILLTEITMSVHVSVIQITEHFIHPAYRNYSVSSCVCDTDYRTLYPSCSWKLHCQFRCMEITVSVHL